MFVNSGAYFRALSIPKYAVKIWRNNFIRKRFAKCRDLYYLCGVFKADFCMIDDNPKNFTTLRDCSEMC